jgi:hypothetical protein
MEDPTYGNFWTEVVDNGLHAHGEFRSLISF